MLIPFMDESIDFLGETHRLVLRFSYCFKVIIVWNVAVASS